MEKTKIKICKTCLLEESEICTFEHYRMVCKKCRY